MKFQCVILFCAMLLFSVIGEAVADEVYLKNGDRITGKVKIMEGGKLVFGTSYAGDLNIDWKEVIDLKTDTPITVVLSDGTQLQGLPKPGETGDLKLDTDILTTPAAFNITKVKAINPKPIPPIKWTARLNFGIKIESGNTEKQEFHFDGQLLAITDKNRFTAGLELDRDTAENDAGRMVRTENNWLATTKYDHFLSKQWFINTNSSYEKDDFKDLSGRTVLGGGAGYQYWKDTEKNLSGELGYAYVNETYDNDVSLDVDYSSVRWALNVDYFLFDKKAQLFHWDEVFMSMQDSDNVWLRSRTGIRFPLYKGFTSTIQYNFDWDNDPAIGAEKVDTTILFTVGFLFEE